MIHERYMLFLRAFMGIFESAALNSERINLDSFIYGLRIPEEATFGPELYPTFSDGKVDISMLAPKVADAFKLKQKLAFTILLGLVLEDGDAKLATASSAYAHTLIFKIENDFNKPPLDEIDAMVIFQKSQNHSNAIARKLLVRVVKCLAPKFLKELFKMVTTNDHAAYAIQTLSQLNKDGVDLGDVGFLVPYCFDNIGNTHFGFDIICLAFSQNQGTKYFGKRFPEFIDQIDFGDMPHHIFDVMDSVEKNEFTSVWEKCFERLIKYQRTDVVDYIKDCLSLEPFATSMCLSKFSNKLINYLVDFSENSDGELFENISYILGRLADIKGGQFLADLWVKYPHKEKLLLSAVYSVVDLIDIAEKLRPVWPYLFKALNGDHIDVALLALSSIITQESVLENKEYIPILCGLLDKHSAAACDRIRDIIVCLYNDELIELLPYIIPYSLPHLEKRYVAILMSLILRFVGMETFKPYAPEAYSRIKNKIDFETYNSGVFYVTNSVDDYPNVHHVMLWTTLNQLIKDKSRFIPLLPKLYRYYACIGDENLKFTAMKGACATFGTEFAKLAIPQLVKPITFGRQDKGRYIREVPEMEPFYDDIIKLLTSNLQHTCVIEPMWFIYRKRPDRKDLLKVAWDALNNALLQKVGCWSEASTLNCIIDLLETKKSEVLPRLNLVPQVAKSVMDFYIEFGDQLTSPFMFDTIDGILVCRFLIALSAVTNYILTVTFVEFVRTYTQRRGSQKTDDTTLAAALIILKGSVRRFRTELLGAINDPQEFVDSINVISTF